MFNGRGYFFVGWCCQFGKLLYFCGEKVVPLSRARIYLNRRWRGFLFFIISIPLLNMGIPYDLGSAKNQLG